MAADTVNIVVRRDAFQGGHNLVPGERMGDTHSRSLPQMFRNLVDELNERIQSGQGTVLNGGTTLAVTLPNAMPDTSYDVQLTFGAAPTNAACTFLFSSTLATTGFTINTNADPQGAGVLVHWQVRSRTRIHTKG